MPSPTVPDLTAQDPVITRTTETIYLPVWKDRDGVVIQNSAKALNLKPEYVPYAISCVTGLFFRATFTDTQVRDLLDGVNSATWRGAWAPGEAWVSEINTREITVSTTALVEITAIVRCLRGKWNLKIPEAGYFYLEGGEYKPFLDSEQNRIIGKLTAGGGKLAVGSDLLIKEFDYKREVNVSSLF